jgi:catechol 2,3-dioxygenase-like lactoylglutathione lyase family enzyme
MEDASVVSLSQTIPALPVRNAAAAVDFYCDRLGFGTREFATVDLDGNLVTFFQWVSP